MPGSVSLTVVMPCLNEERTLAACIRAARRGIEASGLPGEILVVDNGSSDASVSIAEREGARVVRAEETGYGSALRAGFAAARGEWIIMGDADESYDFSHLGEFVRELRGGVDLVMGCRFPSGGGRVEPGAMPWKHRWIGNPVLSFLGRRFFRADIHDFHCGLRAFRREAILRLDLRTKGMEFASEMVIKATLNGLKIAEVPVTLHRDGRNRPPHLRSWRDGWRHLRFMLLFSPRWLFLTPGVAMIALGGLLGVRLVAGPLKLGPFGFDTNTLLVCSMAVIVGFQLCFLDLFTRVFSITEGLRPETGSERALLRSFRLERGVVVGGVMVVLGIALLLFQTEAWRAARFGALSYPRSLRIVVPAVSFITIGVQILFSSFFVGVLEMKRR